MAVVAVAFAVMLSGCSTPQGLGPHMNKGAGANGPLGRAQLIKAQMFGRVRSFSDVTKSYQESDVLAAYSFVDSKLARPDNTLHERPLFIVYRSEGAARRSAAEHKPNQRLGDTVMFVPAAYPVSVRTDYFRAAGTGQG